MEYALQAREIDWYCFLKSCIDYQGVFKRIDLAINDMGGLLDIEILRECYYANKVWKRSRTHEAVDRTNIKNRFEFRLKNGKFSNWFDIISGVIVQLNGGFVLL